MHSTPFHQRGATLLVSLIMLVMLTLFAVTGFNLSSVNLKIAGNFQQQRYVESVVQQEIDRVISTSTIFNAPTAPPAVTIDGVLVEFPAPPACNYFATATGYTKIVGSLVPEDTEWELRATGTDTLGGAKAAITQGVRARLLAGYCP